ncbi:uncharacterized protein DS421_3g68430 [Arachis hypogaea]|nr:uncharacterized protein DS421_3g68430 [Arachis hypogaea]
MVSLSLSEKGLIHRSTEFHLKTCCWPMNYCIHKVEFEPLTLDTLSIYLVL